jgi:hypothetical protein
MDHRDTSAVRWLGGAGNDGSRVAIMVGALSASQKVAQLAEIVGGPVVKALARLCFPIVAHLMRHTNVSTTMNT